ncbi:MAG: response regulator [Cypionkella sp.]
MVTVLLVDDSRLARIVAGKTIAALQPEWQRVEASNADEALAAVTAQTIDLAVLDFNMPGKDGLELAAELREAYPNMPIALITANVQNEIIARARELNATFVSKPVTEETIKGFLSGAALRLRQAGI